MCLYATTYTSCNPKDIQTEHLCNLSDFLWIGDLQAQHYYIMLIFQNLHIRFLTFLWSFPNTVYVQLIHFFVALPLNSLFLPLLCHYRTLLLIQNKQLSQPSVSTYLMISIKVQIKTNNNNKNPCAQVTAFSWAACRRRVPIWMSLDFHKTELLRLLLYSCNQPTSSKNKCRKWQADCNQLSLQVMKE